MRCDKGTKLIQYLHFSSFVVNFEGRKVSGESLGLESKIFSRKYLCDQISPSFRFQFFFSLLSFIPGNGGGSTEMEWRKESRIVSSYTDSINRILSFFFRSELNLSGVWVESDFTLDLDFVTYCCNIRSDPLCTRVGKI